MQIINHIFLFLDEDRGDRAISGEMIGGIVAGILVIVALLLIFLFAARHRQNQTTKVPGIIYMLTL